ncbi:MAG: DNA polymerase III subunit gamma/tau [Bdellovibrionota bacterium]
MGYVVLARKWRSGQFADIVGQSHIVRTLMNAIRAERIHHAYLFTGSRGIGKTSIARIFSKVIRCQSRMDDGGWLKSCDQCSSCKEITTGNSVDVIEIDGASNNGVEAVREIRENAKFLPSFGKYKIYIIDEVHMLTTAAFNALLKTLEEPPAHVIFILATTEPHKIPGTILSRCQRFDYRRMTVAQAQGRLTQITQAEGIDAETAALALIARAAEGSMRDALSLLDQVIAFAGSKISVGAVRESIGLIEGQTLLGILSAVFARKPLEALALVDQAYQRGHDLRVLTRSLIEFLHGAILAKVGAPGSATLELSEDEWKELQAVVALRELEEIEMIFQVLHHGLEWVARSPQPKIVLDVLLVKCASAEMLVSVSETGASGGGLTKAPAEAPRAPASAPSKFTAAPSATAPAPMAPAPQAPAATVAAPKAPRSWEGFIEGIRTTRPLLGSILEHGHCPEVPGGAEPVLAIHFSAKDVYFHDQLKSRAYFEMIQGFARDYFGDGVRVAIEMKETGESLAAKRERELKVRERAAKDAAATHPIIMEAKALFGGELGPIELNDGASERRPGAQSSLQ